MTLEAVDEAQRQVGREAHIEVDHRKLLAAIDAGGGAQHAEAGAVDDDIRLKPTVRQRRGKSGGAIGLAEVECEQLRPGMAARGDLVGDGGQLRLAARHQHELAALRGEFVRDCCANAARCAGDQGYGLHDGGFMSC